MEQQQNLMSTLSCIILSGPFSPYRGHWTSLDSCHTWLLTCNYCRLEYGNCTTADEGQYLVNSHTSVLDAQLTCDRSSGIRRVAIIKAAVRSTLLDDSDYPCRISWQHFHDVDFVPLATPESKRGRVIICFEYLRGSDCLVNART